MTGKIMENRWPKVVGTLMQAVLIDLSLPLLPELLSIQVNVPETQRSTMLFASVTLRCDYSTSANTQDVLITWRYKSFCLDPVLEYYSSGEGELNTEGSSAAKLLCAKLLLSE